jgi:hypothetical protein
VASCRSGVLLLSMAAVLVGATDTRAQSAAIPAWDTAVMTGVFVGHPSVRENTQRDSYDDWYHTATLGIAAGRYLTPHLKAEGELLLSGEGRRYLQQIVQVPGVGPYPIGSEQMVRTNGVSANLVWQFFENQWAHPFVFAGAALDFDRERVRTWSQSYYRGDPRAPGNEVRLSEDRTHDSGTTMRVRGVLGTGGKFYITPRSFFRTDARIGIGGEGSRHLAFRLGFGVDF